MMTCRDDQSDALKRPDAFAATGRMEAPRLHRFAECLLAARWLAGLDGVIGPGPEECGDCVPLVRIVALGIAFLELREPGPHGTFGKSDRPLVAPLIRKVFKGPLVLNSDYDFARGQAAIAAGAADAITFGRRFLANPDLPYRFAHNIELNPDDQKTWYSQGAEGYVTYPAATGETVT